MSLTARFSCLNDHDPDALSVSQARAFIRRQLAPVRTHERLALRSALGRHDAPAHSLAFGPHGRVIVYRTGHMQLLSDPAVGRAVAEWLARKSTADRPG